MTRSVIASLQRLFSTVPALVLFVLAAGCYGVGALAMKSSDGLRHPRAVIAMYALFIVGATIQALSLRRADLGRAYVIVLGFEALMAFGLGVAFYSEQISVTKLFGVVLILSGVYVLH
jgi:multidrug transporter EmrE-like cation transporter